MRKLLLILVIIMASAAAAYSQDQDSTFVFHAYPNLYIPEEDSTGIIDTLEVPIDVVILGRQASLPAP